MFTRRSMVAVGAGGYLSVAIATLGLWTVSSGIATAGTQQEEITGVLNTVWGAIGPDVPPGFAESTKYFLNEFTLVGVEDVTQPLGGPHQFNRKEVTVTGNVLDALTLQVKSIELAEEPPPGPDSHLLGSHVSGAQPWISILCRFGDSTGVTPQPATYFEDQVDLMDDYWRELSYDNVNLTGSQVVGWVNLPDPRSDYVSGGLKFAKALDDCVAAVDAVVNFPDFEGINLMFNEDLDCCSWGGSMTRTLDGVTKTYAVTWEATWGWGNQFVLAQEMGHGFGLPHSSCSYAGTYDSRWDPMSGGSGWGCASPDPDFGCLGVHTIAVFKDALGWIPAARRYVATTDPNQSVFIERLADGGSGFLVAQIPIGGSTTNFYTVESRKFAGFDDQIPGEAVVIHIVDTTLGDRVAQVVDVDAVANTNCNDDGAQWVPGERFVDDVNDISVVIKEETDSGFLVIINGLPNVQINIEKVDKDKPTIKLGDSCWAVGPETVPPFKVLHDVVSDDDGGVKKDFCLDTNNILPPGPDPNNPKKHPANQKLFDKDPAPGSIRITIDGQQRKEFGDIWHVQEIQAPDKYAINDFTNYVCDLSLGKCELTIKNQRVEGNVTFQVNDKVLGGPVLGFCVDLFDDPPDNTSLFKKSCDGDPPPFDNDGVANGVIQQTLPVGSYSVELQKKFPLPWSGRQVDVSQKPIKQFFTLDANNPTFETKWSLTGVIPTVTTWGMVALMLVLLTGLTIKFRGAFVKRA